MNELVLCSVCGVSSLLIRELFLTLWPSWHMNYQKWKMPKLFVVAVVVLRSQVANRSASGQLSYRALAQVSLCTLNCVRVPMKRLLYLYLYLLLYVMVQQRTDRNALRVHFESTVNRGADIMNCKTSLVILPNCGITAVCSWLWFGNPSVGFICISQSWFSIKKKSTSWLNWSLLIIRIAFPYLLFSTIRLSYSSFCQSVLITNSSPVFLAVSS